MFLFSTLKQELLLNTDQKIIRKEEYSCILEAQELIAKVKQEIQEAKDAWAEEMVEIKKKTEEQGRLEGLQQWQQQLLFLEKNFQEEVDLLKQAIIPLVVASVKKIIGKTLEIEPETMSDIIRTATKTILHHRNITIMVSKQDYEQVEKSRESLRKCFSHLQTFDLIAHEDLKPTECIIETEAGIMRVGVEDQLQALEIALQRLLEHA